MQTLLSSRGLAALAWVSTFSAMWAGALGLIESQTQVIVLGVVSVTIAVLAMASASASQKK